MDNSSQYSQHSSHSGQQHQSPTSQMSQQSMPPQQYMGGSGPSPMSSGYEIKSEPGSGSGSGPSPPVGYVPGMPLPQMQHNGQPQPYPYNGQSGSEMPRSIPPTHNAAGAPIPPPAFGGTMPVTQLVTTVTHEPPSHSMIQLGRRYTLDVVQQPKRARMCGFGDKDRRPITPPPCIRLIITDAQTGNEIDVNDIDYGLFVLNVDLWSADGIREVNLVRHSASSPAANIPVAIVGSYATAAGSLHAPIYTNPLPVPTGHPNIVRDPQFPYHINQPQGQSSPNESQAPYNPYPQQPQVNPYSQHNQPPPQDQYNHPSQQGQLASTLPQHVQGAPPGYPVRPGSPFYNPPSRHPDPPNHHVYYHTGNSVHAIASNTVRSMQYDASNPDNMRQISTAQPTATGMFTRNLIGSLAASAFRLTDPNDKVGIWFVLQDLSVRTEGNFRLRFSFVNVGAPGKTPNGNPSNQISIVNTSKAPILASCYSEVFTVFSAKKFPGVVESTSLSKCFAQQGIKIPIRKDGPTKGGGREEYDED